MLATCSNVLHMSKMIQIRNVPDEVHRELKIRAARQGTTLSDLLLREITHVAERPSMDEMLARLASVPPLDRDVDIAEMVRRDRDSH